MNVIKRKFINKKKNTDQSSADQKDAYIKNADKADKELFKELFKEAFTEPDARPEPGKSRVFSSGEKECEHGVITSESQIRHKGRYLMDYGRKYGDPYDVAEKAREHVFGLRNKKSSGRK